MSMLLLFLTFCVFSVIGVPIYIGLGASSLVYLFFTNPDFIVMIPQRIWAGTDAYMMMALPLFILAGELMKVTLMAPVSRPEGHYAVRAHLSLHGEVSIAPEDYLTTQAYPLMSRGTTNALNLAMRRAT